MSSTQHRFSDYLQYDLYHSLGAYRIAEEGLDQLVQRLGLGESRRSVDVREDRSIMQKDLLQLAKIAQSYNGKLGAARHATGVDIRHPIPKELPLSSPNRFAMKPNGGASGEEAADNPWGASLTWAWVPQFYETAIYVLGNEDYVREDWEKGRHGEDEWIEYRFARNLVMPRDGSRRRPTSQRNLHGRRRARYVERRNRAYAHLAGPPRRESLGNEKQDARQPTEDPVQSAKLAQSLAHHYLGTGGSSAGAASLPVFVLNAHAEAHLSMHAVEAWYSMPLGTHAKLSAPEQSWLDDELDRCIALDTFAYSVSRAMPWIFAEDERECKRVFDDLPTAWDHAVPTRCMWIASQVSLLALHRRAYARALRRDCTEAYNDYHKLQRQIRDTERRVQSAPLHVDGALEFLGGLYAQAHYHIGELYRSQHAHQPALNHFRAAGHRLRRLRDEGKADVEQVLTNSRWQVHLYVSSGKAQYELGRHKESLRWHLEAWRALLAMLAASTHTEASTGAVDRAIEWLEDIRYEPDLRKFEVQQHLRPVIDQLDGIVIDERIGTLAADILLRLGHLLFVLNIVPPERMKGILNDRGHRPAELRRSADRVTEQARTKEAIRDTLALDCLRKAAECDPHSTLVAADELKAIFRIRQRIGDLVAGSKDLAPTEMVPITEQWPNGGDDYERLVRATEYLMLKALRRQTDVSFTTDDVPDQPEAQDEMVARRLLLSFFTHTDSINVRKSQAHLSLIKERHEQGRPDQSRKPAVEFVCMRRYSSAFPLLPRPSAFRALLGGYFVRLHSGESPPAGAAAEAAGKAEGPFGIVVDPGVDFVENLYRSGYSLSDIDMIVVTHDHVDHMGSLDSLLSLLHERRGVLRHQGTAETIPSPKLLVNNSVRDRYKSVKLFGKDDLRTFDQLARDDSWLTEDERFPSAFRILSMSTRAVDGKGHLDLSGNPSYAVCFKAEGSFGEVSLAIAGDMPRPPTDLGARTKWRETWAEALSADALVAHLSTIPLTEMRQLANLDATNENARATDSERNRHDAERLVKLAEPLIRLAKEHRLKELRERLAAILKTATRIMRLIDRDRPQGEVVEQAEQLDRLVAEMSETITEAIVDPASRADFDRFTLEAGRLALATRLPSTDASELEDIRRRLQDYSNLQGRIEFGLWLRPRRTREPVPTASLLGPMPEDWQPPRGHLYLNGLLDLAREYRDQRAEKPGTFVIGELSEELGTVRTQIAGRLNKTIFKVSNVGEPQLHAITSDIGLRMFVLPPDDLEDPPRPTKVLCTNCNLDTDRVPHERFHQPKDIREVCVKGENEGIFYNCIEHDPSSQEEHTFLEQLERFDVFGR